eukprot:CAMPEP_0119469836 /NCGR_PEP_ID=MMETSP1344-20130328/2994_1 /TAXON_ID=236787 /ORGANISM="Florenciella parvula, Strain CCMP2471" /LENGTH=234 /DNA_ID=CAMNT_0007502441 /DNA_START=239 /DNA_END=940 /DNA_ORIENTATION=+
MAESAPQSTAMQQQLERMRSPTGVHGGGRSPIGQLIKIGPGNGTICTCESFDPATSLYTLSVLGHPKCAMTKVVCDALRLRIVVLDETEYRRAKDRQRKSYGRSFNPRINTMQRFTERARIMTGTMTTMLGNGNHKSGPYVEIPLEGGGSKRQRVGANAPCEHGHQRFACKECGDKEIWEAAALKKKLEESIARAKAGPTLLDEEAKAKRDAILKQKKKEEEAAVAAAAAAAVA